MTKRKWLLLTAAFIGGMALLAWLALPLLLSPDPAVTPENFDYLSTGSSFQTACAVLGDPTDSYWWAGRRHVEWSENNYRVVLYFDKEGRAVAGAIQERFRGPDPDPRDGPIIELRDGESITEKLRRWLGL